MWNVKQKRHTHDDPHRDEDNLECENNKRMLKTSQSNVKCKTKATYTWRSTQGWRRSGMWKQQENA